MFNIDKYTYGTEQTAIDTAVMENDTASALERLHHYNIFDGIDHF